MRAKLLALVDMIANAQRIREINVEDDENRTGLKVGRDGHLLSRTIILKPGHRTRKRRDNAGCCIASSSGMIRERRGSRAGAGTEFRNLRDFFHFDIVDVDKLGDAQRIDVVISKWRQ